MAHWYHDSFRKTTAYDRLIRYDSIVVTFPKQEKGGKATSKRLFIEDANADRRE